MKAWLLAGGALGLLIVAIAVFVLARAREDRERPVRPARSDPGGLGEQ
jgi:hypothetical protein